MKHALRSRLALATAGIAALALGLAWTKPWNGLARPASRAASLPREVTDLAVGVLGAAAVRPPVGELTDEELDDLVWILGHLIRAYVQGRFDSYLALRAADVEFASAEQQEHVEELRSICVELGRRREELPADWRGLLEAYWKAYYTEAPVAALRPEASVLELHREGLGTRSLAAWEDDFEALCAPPSGFHLRHRMMIPHRRPMECVASDVGPLRWIDLRLAFEGHDAAAGRLIARFVWDGLEEEWFLHRATTILDGELRDDRRHLVL